MKLLIRLPNWLGDVVMASAFVAAVKELYPDAVVDVIVKSELAGIAPLIPGINTIHHFSKNEFKGLPGAYRFGKALRTEKYDIFFNLPSSISSSTMAWASGAKKRIGFAKEGGLFLLTNAYKAPKGMHRVDEYLSLLEQFSRRKILNRTVKLAIDHTAAVNKKRVIVNFNSEAASRRMPLDKGRHLIGLLTSTFTDSTFTFIGSAKETVFVSQLIIGSENADRLENFAGKTDLKGLCGLIADSAVVLTTDSGPAHLANGLGKPVVVLFGAGNETNTAPYNKQDMNVLRYGNLECEPCVRNTCELYGIPKCMQLLDELQIINALSLYLSHA